MTAAEMGLLFAEFFGAWTTGFVAGYLMTQFRRAVDEVAN